MESVLRQQTMTEQSGCGHHRDGKELSERLRCHEGLKRQDRQCYCLPYQSCLPVHSNVRARGYGHARHRAREYR